ncbi:neurofilament medium polypeptide-like [Hylaeus volcanicus]|uniref:neurofilament medium polypeptide-like n=1 Tax=Hylaeus volcanicus TaxID=313075 RepID=UPI0023B83631|nr:neurofilament medium polypeptide-like [Hylaeus volcanicus]
MISIRDILEATGSTREDAERAATVIQAAFRGHYERMALNEAQGKVQWQRAVTNTLDILRKAGATQAEISAASRYVKFAYRSYYIRRNQRIDAPDTEEELKKDPRILETAEAIQAVAWMEMMYHDSGLTLEKANEAATVIQRAYKKYRMRKAGYDVQQLQSTKSMVVDAVLSSLHHKVFDRVTSREDIPEEYGTREELMMASTKIQMAFKEHLRMTRLSEQRYLEAAADEEEEFVEDEDTDSKFTTETEDVVITERSPDSEHHPLESEAKSEIEYTEEQLTEAEMDEQEASEVEITTELLPTSAEPQSELETEYPSEPELEEEAAEDQERGEETKEPEEEHKHEETEEEPNVAQETGTPGDAAE